jgi:uncharacterized coiled-coil DUF342 family protein
MDNYLKVEGYNDFFRDPQTNSIINVNMTEYQQYLTRRSAKNEEHKKINNLESEVSGIKDDLNEIKNLLRSLINES